LGPVRIRYAALFLIFEISRYFVTIFVRGGGLG
jgi:hypothetical protein